MALRKHYLLANIGDQYMRLDIDEYDGPERIKENIQMYLDKWDYCKLNGMGLEFYSKELGTGKTFLATYVGRELIKKGEAVFFIPFIEIIGLHNRPEEQRNEIEERLRDSTVLILDEVIEPGTNAQSMLFSARFEELIRHRQNFNRITIMTTNLEPEELLATYPRSYSLLEAKQFRVEMPGTDRRRGKIDLENIERIANGEVKPIS